MRWLSVLVKAAPGALQQRFVPRRLLVLTKGFRVDYYLRPFACLKAEVAAMFGVPAIRVGEGFALPLRRLNSLADRVNKDIDVFEARQVDIPGEVFG